MSLPDELAERKKSYELGRQALAGDPKSAPVQKEKPKPIPPGSPRYGDRPGEKRIDVTPYVKPLGSLKKGTKRVPKTGAYTLHKDEAVLNKKDADQMRDRAGSAMGGKKSKSKSKGKKGGKKKHVHEMHIRHSANGGYIAKHILQSLQGGAPQEPQEHTLGDMDQLTQHVQDNMGQPPPAMPPPQETPRGGM